MATTQQLADLVDVKRLLGNEDGGRATGDARIRSNPSAVAPHHLDHHHPIVALCCGVQSVDRVGGDLNRRIEAEGHVRADHIVVDGLGHTDDWQAEVLVQLASDRQRPIATDDQQRVKTHVGESGLHALRAVLVVVRTTAAGAQQRATPGQHSAQRRHVERNRSTVHHAVPRIEETNELVAVYELALADDRPNHRVEARAIAPTCQNAYSHVYEA